MYEEIEDNLDFRVKPDIQVQIVAKLPDKEYGETEFSFRDIYYHGQYYEDTNEDDLGEILNAAVDEVKNNIEEDQDNDNII